jgi:hypothetical protein
MSNSCLYCAWWKNYDIEHNNILFGECRRYPPTRSVTTKDPIRINMSDSYGSQITDDTMETSGWWIVTRSDDFCGEFKLDPDEEVRDE